MGKVSLISGLGTIRKCVNHVNDFSWYPIGTQLGVNSIFNGDGRF